jgi:hypothetical protein
LARCGEYPGGANPPEILNPYLNCVNRIHEENMRLGGQQYLREYMAHDYSKRGYTIIQDDHETTLRMPGFETENGGIKIHLFRLEFQCSF